MSPKTVIVQLAIVVGALFVYDKLKASGTL